MLSSNLCPVCEVVKAHGEQGCEHGCTGEEVEGYWIDGPVDSALNHVEQSNVLCAMLGWDAPED